MKELLSEVFAVMRSNKLRLLLTGFSIGWGLFILIVMLGSGNGVVRGVTASFGPDTLCTLYLSPAKTSQEWHGHGAQRDIVLHIEDAEAISNAFADEVRAIRINNQSPPVEIVSGPRKIKSAVVGCQIGYYQFDYFKITQGRDFTDIDMQRHSRVCLLGQQSIDILFGKNADPLGKDILVDDINFRIVGIYDSPHGYGSGHTVYVPFSTGRDLFATDGTLSQIVVVANNVRNDKQLQDFKEKIYGFLAERLDFSPDDKIAVTCNSDTDLFFQLDSVLGMIQLFIWIVGLATLISGVVGVSNMMIIGIKERTREFGVRIAMGASDVSIIRLVLLESVIITLIFGYIGMMLGIGLTQGMDFILKSMGGVTFFENPTVDFSIMITALLIMIVAGLIAGIFPAIQAVRMKLVDLLNS